MSKEKLRAVFDTNVYISAFNYGGNPERAYRLANNRKFTLITSPFILRETARILRKTFLWKEKDITTTVKQIARLAEIVIPTQEINKIEHLSDNRILECAIEGKAHLIISGDRHLLNLKEFKGIPIIRVVDFVRIFEGQGDDYNED